MAISNVARFDAIRSILFGSITNSFAVLGSPLAHITRVIKFTNTTNANMFISYDGTTTNDIVSAGGFVLYDIMSNAGNDGQFSISRGTQLYIKYDTAPTSGMVVVTCIYAKGE